ncbi:hypothetical protein AB0N12_32995, partial [Streptomyces albogriseolus]
FPGPLQGRGELREQPATSRTRHSRGTPTAGRALQGRGELRDQPATSRTRQQAVPSTASPRTTPERGAQ